MDEANRLKRFPRASVSGDERASQWDVYNGLGQPIKKMFKRAGISCEKRVIQWDDYSG